MATEYYVRWNFGNRDCRLGPLPAERIVIAASMLHSLAGALDPRKSAVPGQIELYVRKDGRAVCVAYEDFYKVFDENRLKHAMKGEGGLLEAIADLHFQDSERSDVN